ncbi:MAG: DUF1302 family protein [Pseudomonadota bacterium]
MSRRRWGKTVLCLLFVIAISGIVSTKAVAEMTSSFHGTFESNIVVRDTDGMQYGFFDEAYGIQQRNTLKFDIDVYPEMKLGAFRVEKVHLTFRGAYDSIFDLAAHRYDIADDIGGSRFDYNLEDIRFEQDLREAFIDFVYTGKFGDGFFRPGRQIVSWGEGLLETLNDVINPPDSSFNLFFQNPDDVKIPLWMGRINYSMPRIQNFGLNFDLLWVPDIRPAQWGPRDGTPTDANAGYQAPYVSIINFADLDGFTVREKVPTNNNEYGGKITAEIGQRLNLSVLYFRDVVSDPNGMVMYIPAMEVDVTHNKQHVYGGFFSYQLLVGHFEAIIRGEVSRHTAEPISLASGQFDARSDGGRNLFVLKPVTKTMLAVDKDFRWRWLSKDVTKVSFEWLHKTINEWESRLSDPQYDTKGRVTGKLYTNVKKERRNDRESDVFMVNTSTALMGAKLTPSILLAVCPGKHGDGTTWMVKPAVKYLITSDLYADLRLQAFLGDSKASYGFADGVKVASEVTFKLGYQW